MHKYLAILTILQTSLISLEPTLCILLYLGHGQISCQFLPMYENYSKQIEWKRTSELFALTPV